MSGPAFLVAAGGLGAAAVVGGSLVSNLVEL